MPLPSTTLADLVGHLRTLGVRRGEKLVVHSRLIAFGVIEGGPETVYRALRAVVGEEGTIAVPTYTMNVGSETPYDPSSTPSDAVGALSEYVRCLPEAHRSRCPIHSHAAVGPAAGMLNRLSGEVSIGPDSDFEAFLDGGFSVLMLGCTYAEGCTFLHHMEAVVGVPYREWLDLPRQIRNEDGDVRRVVCRYYGRATDDYREDFDAVERALTNQRRLTPVACPFGHSTFVPLTDLFDAIKGMLKDDPFALVRQASPANA